MTPKQLRYYTMVIRHGGVSAAAVELGVSQAAVSASVASLRRELGDPLFHASRRGLVTTAGGRLLAHRALEIIDLQERTANEVALIDNNRRPLGVTTTALCAEYGVPGLLEVLSRSVDDIDAEFTTQSSDEFPETLVSGRAELTIGPRRATVSPGIITTEFLGFEVIAVSTPEMAPSWGTADWCVGPSAVEPGGVCQFIIGRARVSRERLRLHLSHAAAVEQARLGHGIALVPSFAVSNCLASGALVKVNDARLHAGVTWTASVLADRTTSAAEAVIGLLQDPSTAQTICAGAGVTLDDPSAGLLASA